jgi:hypothetical protein
LDAGAAKVEADEYFARWEPDFKTVEATRDELAAEMREVYPAAVAQLVDLFHRMTACDRECSRINGLAPPGEHRRLRQVELTARGVDRLLQPDVWIAETLRLPVFPRDTGPILAWPPPAPPPWVSGVIPLGPASDWQAEIAARNEAHRIESERIHAQRHTEQRERAEREAREGREAIEREVAERNRREGWPYP